MGMRLGANLKMSRFAVAPVEVSAAGRERLTAELGWTAEAADQALDGAEIVVLAVPDAAIGKVALGIVDKLKPGTMVIILDAAAPYAGHLPERKDITYFVTHPCHPPIFNDETEAKAKLDRFGGVAAKQAIVCCLMQGPEVRLCQGRGSGEDDLVTRHAVASFERGAVGTAGAGAC